MYQVLLEQKQKMCFFFVSSTFGTFFFDWLWKTKKKKHFVFNCFVGANEMKSWNNFSIIINFYDGMTVHISFYLYFSWVVCVFFFCCVKMNREDIHTYMNAYVCNLARQTNSVSFIIHYTCFWGNCGKVDKILLFS